MCVCAYVNALLIHSITLIMTDIMNKTLGYIEAVLNPHLTVPFSSTPW